MNLNQFLTRYCEGRMYKTCINSPCQFSSKTGCTHPSHPKNEVKRGITRTENKTYKIHPNNK